VVGAVSVFQDITPIRELDQQKDEFLATVSHDLQQPLAVIKGRAQLLRRRLARGESPDPARITDGLATIEATVGDMAGQVAELLDATRLHMGRPLELEYASTDLVSFLRQVVADWAGTSPHHEIVLLTELTTLHVVVDAARLRRVIANLLSNAIKYSPGGGRVRLGLEREGPPRLDRECALISVSDRGVGIPAADVPHIFERYYRAGNAARAAGGTGLGLAGARQIVVQHCGTISVTSTEGEGSTFLVRLPI
jgi:signal transduction histidine kinase